MLDKDFSPKKKFKFFCIAGWIKNNVSLNIAGIFAKSFGGITVYAFLIKGIYSFFLILRMDFLLYDYISELLRILYNLYKIIHNKDSTTFFAKGYIS